MLKSAHFNAHSSAQAQPIEHFGQHFFLWLYVLVNFVASGQRQKNFGHSFGLSSKLWDALKSVNIPLILHIKAVNDANLGNFFNPWEKNSPQNQNENNRFSYKLPTLEIESVTT